MMHTKKLTDSVKFSDRCSKLREKEACYPGNIHQSNIKTCRPLHYYLINYRKLANLLRNKNYKS